MKALQVVLLLLLGLLGARALPFGDGKPAMGFNTWNAFRTDINEKQIMKIADLMVSLGLRDAGYTYLNLDDAWSEKQRVGGKLVANKERFPSGIKALADYVHSKGLKFGIYGDAGTMTCALYPGSLGYEEVDAQTFAEWGVDYLKYDNCFAKREDWVLDRYRAMGEALNKTGRPIFYSLCNWGVMEPWLWAPQIGHSWRITEDILPTWDNVVKLLDYSVGLSRLAGKGIGHHDMDMLYVGNDHLGEYHPYGPFYQEHKMHFALWALMKSPLMVGHDLRRINQSSLDLLLNKEIIAINQDELGVPGDLIWQQGTRRIFAAPLTGGARAVVMANFQTTQTQYPMSNVTVYWEQLGLRRDQAAGVRDIYGGQDLGVFRGSFSAAIATHDVAVLRIAPLEGPTNDGWRPWHGQPLYAAQPANLAVPQPQDWIPNYSGPRTAASAQSQDKQQQQKAAQRQVPSTSHGPPSFALVLACVAAVAALGVVGYYIVLQRRLRGWQQLEDSEAARKAGELARMQQRSKDGWGNGA
ncbi:hypothetical protein ABPG75_013610 [Micractinium tetrahymenae]